jgi:D-beta-D-heptose 7-phosphate kinase/D-beta-D-heptose 1-phosphate adenosyltransferase
MSRDEILARHVRAMGSPRIGIVGDFILDRYVAGEVHRISPEAPIQVLESRREEDRLGGAGNVVENVAAMGGKVLCAGVLGGDPHARVIRRRLRDVGADASGLVEDPERPTALKTRFMAGIQQVLRVDRESVAPIRGEVERSLLAAARRIVRESDLVVLSDYGKGALTETVVAEVIAQARRAGRRVLVDPKAENFARYRGAWAITPNRAEAEVASGQRLRTDEDLERAAESLLDVADLSAIVVTLGPDGMYFRTREGEAGTIPTRARAVFDVTGAGDTVIAHLALFLSRGIPLEESLRLANAAAGIVVGKPGTATVTREELLAELERAAPHAAKVLAGLVDLETIATAWRREGKKIVFTNGCFDLLHPGHVRLLREARSFGDVLVVGVNDDASVRRLKGNGRPVTDLAGRLAVLAALEAVDAVVPFSEDTPIAVIRKLRPDVLVKGADWRGKEVVGADWVRSHGGIVRFVELEEGRSTSATIRRVAARTRERSRSRSARRPTPPKLR